MNKFLLDAVELANSAVVLFDKKVRQVSMNGRALGHGFMDQKHLFAADPPPYRVEHKGLAVFLQLETPELLVYVARPTIDQILARRLVQEKFQFTPRETEVLWLLFLGSENPEIARQLGIQTSGVKSLVFRAYTKMNVRSRAEAVRTIAEFLGGAQIGEKT